MSDQETREKRIARRRRKQKEFGRHLDIRHRPEDRYVSRPFNADAYKDEELDHGDDLFHDPTDGNIRELNFHDDDEV